MTNVGDVANTAEPEPVSSVNAVLKSEELKEPNDVVVLLDVIAPVRFGILVVVVAVPVNYAVILPVTTRFSRVTVPVLPIPAAAILVNAIIYILFFYLSD